MRKKFLVWEEVLNNDNIQWNLQDKLSAEKNTKLTWTSDKDEDRNNWNKRTDKSLNFLLIDETDRNKISSIQKRLFFAVSLYHFSFFANTPFKNKEDS